MNTRNEELEKMLYEHITKDMTHKKFVKEVGKSSSSYMVSSRVDYRRRHVCVVVRLSFYSSAALSSFIAARLSPPCGTYDSPFRRLWWIFKDLIKEECGGCKEECGFK